MVIFSLLAIGFALFAAEIRYHNRVAYTVAEFKSLAKQDYNAYEADQSLVYVDMPSDIATSPQANHSGKELAHSGSQASFEERVKGWYVVLAAFNELQNAEKLRKELENNGYIAFRRNKNDRYQVVVYAGKSAVEAKQQLKKLDQHYGIRGDVRQMKMQSHVN